MSFSLALGQFASASVSSNPNLLQEVVATHLVENEFGFVGADGLFAGARKDHLLRAAVFCVDHRKNYTAVAEDIVAGGIVLIANNEIEWDGGGDFGGLRMSSSGHEQNRDCDESGT